MFYNLLILNVVLYKKIKKYTIYFLLIPKIYYLKFNKF